jgi:hypothetical protein
VASARNQGTLRPGSERSGARVGAADASHMCCVTSEGHADRPQRGILPRVAERRAAAWVPRARALGSGSACAWLG